MRPRAAVRIMKSRPHQTMDITINFKGSVDIKTHQNIYGAAGALFLGQDGQARRARSHDAIHDSIHSGRCRACVMEGRQEEKQEREGTRKGASRGGRWEQLDFPRDGGIAE